MGRPPRTTASTSFRVDEIALLPEFRMRDDFPGKCKLRQLATCNTDAARIGHPNYNGRLGGEW
ncbi:hypothetical protein F1880_000084 [Penicillium rolfsii]|nr:hypothetical protein F1880_000084 [Penicillium rolfsii]